MSSMLYFVLAQHNALRHLVSCASCKAAMDKRSQASSLPQIRTYDTPCWEMSQMGPVES